MKEFHVRDTASPYSVITSNFDSGRMKYGRSKTDFEPACFYGLVALSGVYVVYQPSTTFQSRSVEPALEIQPTSFDEDTNINPRTLHVFPHVLEECRRAPGSRERRKQISPCPFDHPCKLLRPHFIRRNHQDTLHRSCFTVLYRFILTDKNQHLTSSERLQGIHNIIISKLFPLR